MYQTLRRVGVWSVSCTLPLPSLQTTCEVNPAKTLGCRRASVGTLLSSTACCPSACGKHTEGHRSRHAHPLPRLMSADSPNSPGISPPPAQTVSPKAWDVTPWVAAGPSPSFWELLRTEQGTSESSLRHSGRINSFQGHGPSVGKRGACHTETFSFSLSIQSLFSFGSPQILVISVLVEFSSCTPPFPMSLRPS